MQDLPSRSTSGVKYFLQGSSRGLPSSKEEEEEEEIEETTNAREKRGEEERLVSTLLGADSAAVAMKIGGRSVARP